MQDRKSDLKQCIQENMKMLPSWRQVQNTHWEWICWESPTEGFGLRVKVIWARGLTLGRRSDFLDELRFAACSGGTQEEAAGGPCPPKPGDEVSWAAVVSQAWPLVPGLHTHSWGRRHIPPFWHGGTQLAAGIQQKTHFEGEQYRLH